MGPSTRSTPSSLRGPSANSRKFTGTSSALSRSTGRTPGANRHSYTEPDNYSVPLSVSKVSRSTAYAEPLSFTSSSSTSSLAARTPLTREALEILQATHEAEAASTADPPASPAAAKDFDGRFDESSFLAFMRKSKSRSPEKKKPDRKKSKDKDADSHPLNLPPEELKRLSARLARDSLLNQRSSAEQMADVDMDAGTSAGSETAQPYTNGSTSRPSSPGVTADTPGAFPDPQVNGDAREDTKSPTPPPHKVPPKPPVDPEACKAAGNKFFKAKDYDRAVAEYTKAVEADPQNATYLSNRAAAYIGAHRYDQALQDCLQANSLEPANDKILHRLARIYTSLGRPEDALATYSKIPNASNTDTAAAKRAQSSIDMAERQIYAEDGDGKMALWSIDQAKQTLGAGSPMPRRWQILRARANLKIGSTNSLGEVQSITQTLMRDNSMDAEAMTLAGRAFYLKDDKGVGKSDYQRAEDCFRRALSIDPDNSDARNALRMMKKLDRAKTDANNFYKAKQWQRANDAYTECLAIDPSNKITNAKILGNRALARTKLELFDEARQDCDQALKLDPTYTKAKRTRAKIVGEAGDWEQAVKDLKALSEESPGDSEIQKELRNAELELKKSKRKDWYKILGVSKDAGEKEIERAYKKKAAVLHPDKTQGDKEKEEQFKDCLEAKEVLMDPQRRQIFDSGADLMEPGMGGMGGHPFGGFGGMGGMGGGVQIDPEMLFNMMGGMGGAGGGRGGMGGGFPGGFTFSTGGPGMGGQRGGFPF